MTERKFRLFSRSGGANSENPAEESQPAEQTPAEKPAELPEPPASPAEGDDAESEIRRLRALLKAERADRAREARTAEAGRLLRDAGLSDQLSDLVMAPTAGEVAQRVARLRDALDASVRRELIRRIGTAAPGGGTPPRLTREAVRNLPLSELSDLIN